MKRKLFYRILVLIHLLFSQMQMQQGAYRYMDLAAMERLVTNFS
jgi:hypothetical protein